jgi:hypothetical protein
MRKIGITLWLVAIILAAGLSAVLLRTNLLGGPEDRSSDPALNSNLGNSGPPTKAPGAASDTAPGPTTTVPTTLTVPTTSPAFTPPTTVDGPNDFYHALQRIAQQLVGTDGNGRGGGSDFPAWYEQLEATSGRTVPADVAFAWYQHLFPDRVHGERTRSADALTCGTPTSSLGTCPGGPGNQG